MQACCWPVRGDPSGQALRQHVCCDAERDDHAWGHTSSLPGLTDSEKDVEMKG